MQLHGYLESLFKYSDAADVTVLLKSIYPYKKVREAFPQVNFIVEYNFGRQLREFIESTTDFIMFGCDDVVFTDDLCLKEACEYLGQTDDVFGFSLRLGDNIKGLPEHEVNENVYSWNWNGPVDDYHYPWEMDCTIYRASDVKELIRNINHPIINPNYLEDEYAVHTEAILRPKLACFSGKGKGIVITVNRCVETHNNPVFGNDNTDLDSLYRMYEEGYLMDIEKISELETDKIHVGDKYFILKKAENKGEKKRMYVGERFKKNGKTYEVTAIISDTNYAYREVGDEPVFAPSFTEEVEEVKETKAKRGRKKV